MTTKKSNFPSLAEIAVDESLRDWFKKEKWVRISSSGNIAGPCGTSKNKKNPDRCLPKAKAQSLTKGERAATARKKKKAGAKGKTVVKNTKKAKVKETSNPQDGKAAPYGSGYKPTNMKNKNETKGAPKGHYFTKSGNLVKGRLTKDAREKGARLSDPKDKQRSKVPPVTQYNEGTDLYLGRSFSMKRFSGPNGIALQVTAPKLKGSGFEYIQIDGKDVKEFARGAVHVAQEFHDIDRQTTVNENVKKYRLGDMYSNDFDYVGMLKAGLKATLGSSVQKLQKLYNSFEDVNYHSENQHLGGIINALKAGNRDAAKDSLEKFRNAIKATLKDMK